MRVRPYRGWCGTYLPQLLLVVQLVFLSTWWTPLLGAASPAASRSSSNSRDNDNNNEGTTTPNLSPRQQQQNRQPSFSSTPDRSIEITQDDELGLRVTLRRETLDYAPSCIHTFAQIELLNLRDNEDIFIHSITTSPEETVVLDTKSKNIAESSDAVRHLLPQQLFVSRLPQGGGGLRLGPEQVAIVPIRFLPRFPSLDEYDYDDVIDANTGADSDTVSQDEDDDDDLDDIYGQGYADCMLRATGVANAPSSSPITNTWAQQMDLQAWLGSSPTVLQNYHSAQTSNHHNFRKQQYYEQRRQRRQKKQQQQRNSVNYNDEDECEDEFCCDDPPLFRVSTEILVETNRGYLTLPMHATSVRRNEYGVPDVLRFYVRPENQTQNFESAEEEKANFVHSSSSTFPSSSSSSSNSSFDEDQNKGLGNGNTIRTTHWTIRGETESNDRDTLHGSSSRSSADNNNSKSHGHYLNQYDDLDDYYEYNKDDDCHDVHLKHPMDSDAASGTDEDLMNVLEVVMTTRVATPADSVGMTLQVLSKDHLLIPGRRTKPQQFTTTTAAHPHARTPSSSSSTSSSSKTTKKAKSSNPSSIDMTSSITKLVTATFLRQVIRDWTNGSSRDATGPRPVPPDDRMHYLVTVCTAVSSSVGSSDGWSNDGAGGMEDDDDSGKDGSSRNVNRTKEQLKEDKNIFIDRNDAGVPSTEDEKDANTPHDYMDDELKFFLRATADDSSNDNEGDDGGGGGGESSPSSPSVRAKSSNWLGFLQIRTELDTLFVGLERAVRKTRAEGARKRSTTKSSTSSPGNVESGGTVKMGQKNMSLDGMSADEDENERVENVGKDNNRDETEINDDEEKRECGDDDDDEDSVCEETLKDENEPILLAQPEKISIHLLSSASPTASIPIHLLNARSHQPIKIMRVSAIWNVSVTGLDERVGFKITILGQALDDATPIALNETLQQAFFFECSIDWDLFMKDTSLNEILFNGTVLVRGSSLGMSYHEWESAMRSNPHLDSNLVVEIPFSVAAIKGNIGFVVQGTSHPFSLFWLTKRWHGYMKSVDSAFFPLTANDIRASIESDGEIDHDFFAMKSMDHHLRIFTNVNVHTDVKNVIIIDRSEIPIGSKSSDSLCERLEAEYIRFPGSNPFDLPDQTDLGMVHLKFNIAGTTPNTTLQISPVKLYPTVCSLCLTTEPDTGEHFVPLLVFSGQVQVSGSLFRPDKDLQNSTNKDDERSIWQRTFVGFDKVTSWLQNTKIGATLREVLGSSMENRKNTVRDSVLLGRYLNGLANISTESESTRMKPVLLQAGAIAQGETETYPLFFTNHNPVAVKIFIDVGEVEGMSISLGRDHSGGKGDGNSILDHLPRKPRVRMVRDNLKVSEPRVNNGPFQGHPVNGLRQFLLSNELAGSFLSRFPYRDAIALSEGAISRAPELEKLFGLYAVAKYHRTMRPIRNSSAFPTKCGELHEYPPLYGPFEKKRKSWRRLPGPIIISGDGKKARQLNVCWGREMNPDKVSSEGSVVVLPPGGVARFDISLRSPPSTVLDKDITEFLATGLVLSTNHGEVMPIFVSFEALQGKLDVTHVPSATESTNIAQRSGRSGLIKVPVALFTKPSQPLPDFAIRIPPKTNRPAPEFLSGAIITRNTSSAEAGVALYMKSSFSRDVLLREVSSCNPWFQVVLRHGSQTHPDPYLGIDIGVVKSVASCEDSIGMSVNVSGHPSFFRCALSWLSHRAELQPRGCGLLPMKAKRSVDSGGNQVAERSAVERAIKSLKRSILLSEISYGPFSTEYDVNEHVIARKSGRRNPNGIVPPVIIDSFADAFDSWRTVSEFGLRSLSTSLRAVIEYNSSASGSIPQRTHVLSVALANLTIESSLDIPKLVDESKSFKDVSREQIRSDEISSIFFFPPTPVAKVAAIKFPLKNPTGVPLRVRLGVALPKDKYTVPEVLASELKVDEAVRDRFIGDFPSPFIQLGSTLHETNDDLLRDQWWDGEGTFYMASNDGDLIRSLHNVSLSGSPTTQITFQLPSLLGNTGFLVGCSSRCAVKEDVRRMKLLSERILSSPIGASAAQGEVLMGRDRSKKSAEGKNEPTDNDIGKSPLMSGTSGPAAFGIPFSAFDEIIIPPFGEAEIGPILFRPPGRKNYRTCNSGILDSSLCDPEIFEAVVFLENSLTGLERVLLRGRAQWEKLDFVDDLSRSESDDYSNLETRFGRTALIFSGREALNGKDTSFQHSEGIVKEVFLHNFGDTVVVIGAVYFSNTAKLHIISEFNSHHQCSHGDFQVLNCSFLSRGFTLPPGKNVSIAIKHIQRCRKEDQFVALNFEVLDQNNNARFPKNTSISIGWMKRGFERIGKNSPFGKRKIELLLGYEVPKQVSTACPSMLSRSRLRRLGMGQWHRSKSEGQNSSFPSLFFASDASMALIILFCFCAIVASLASVAIVSYSRFATTNSFGLSLEGCAVGSDILKNTSSDNWVAAFRCLARADPTSLDLQNLGREQVRHIVLAKYRTLGVLQPQCLSRGGAFHRERGTINSKSGRSSSNVKEGSGERIRTLSDAIFRDYRSDTIFHGRQPHSLGWRVAVSRGIVDMTLIEHIRSASRTEALLEARRQMSEEDSVSKEDLEDASSSAGDGESVTFHASMRSNSSGDSSSEPSHNIVSVASLGNESNTCALAKQKDSPQKDAVIDTAIEEGKTVSLVQSGDEEVVKSTEETVDEALKVEGTTATEKIVTKTNNDIQCEEISFTIVEKLSENNELVLPTKGEAIRTVKKRQRSRRKPKDKGKGKAIAKDSPSVESNKTAGHPADIDFTDAKVQIETTGESGQKKKGKRSKKNSKNASENKDPEKLIPDSKTKVDDAANAEKYPKLAPVSLPLRPPPGLAPPPGFGVQAGSPFAMPISAPSSVLSHPDAKPIIPFDTPDLPNWSSRRENRNSGGGSSDLSLSSSPNVAPSPHSIYDIPPRSLYEENHIGASQEMNGFDVLDFLDSILNDGSASAGDANKAKSEKTVTDESLNTAPSSIPLVGSNPWAPTGLDLGPHSAMSLERRSRLSAYGISIEEESDHRADASLNNTQLAGDGDTLPLLTPAAILSGELEGKKGQSFYANLLEEGS